MAASRRELLRAGAFGLATLGAAGLRPLLAMKKVEPDLSKIDPSDRSKYVKDTARLALAQTIVARGLLYHPKDDFRTDLGIAAASMKTFFTGLNAHCKVGFCARILGPE